MPNVYRGFSTFQKKGFAMKDQQLVVRDLLNHIYTIRGERVMMPGFGTRIPLLAFEPLDPQTLQIVEDDLRAVVDYDPRVRLVDIAVLALSEQSAIVAILDLEYLELRITETLRLEFAVGG